MQTQQEGVVDVQVHRLAAKLLFDEHALSPYWGLVSAFDPDIEGTSLVFAGEDYTIETVNYWRGKLDDPTGGVEGGLYEYKLGVWTDDEANDKGVDFTFRPGFPNAEHVETGEQIGGMPEDCPESIRVQVEATNLDRLDVFGLLQTLARAIDLNPKYFSPGTAHEWSSIYGLETYVRLDRYVAQRHLVGSGGIFEDLALFSSDDGKGEWKWDHEEITGHYEAVALDPGSWAALLPEQSMPKRAKCYQPQHPRQNDQEDDPLFHHKLEAQYWSGYDSGTLDWDSYPEYVDELRETTLNILSWAGVALHPDTGAGDDGDGVFVEDSYFEVEPVEEPVRILSNPIPERKDYQQVTARETLLDPSITDSEWEVLRAMTDGGEKHHEELAAESETSSSTVYRAAERFETILTVENGTLQFVDDVVQSEIVDIIDRFEAAKENTLEALQRTADRLSPLRDSDEPSALERWMNSHGIIPKESFGGLELELERPVSAYTLRQILRAGLQAAEGSPMLTEHFEAATIHWRDLKGNSHRNWQVVVDGEILQAGGGSATL